MDAYPDIVDAVLWFLGALSLLIWAIALAKFVAFRRNAGSNRRFLAEFERVQDTDQLHAVAQTASGSLARLGRVAAQEVAALRRLPELVDAARRDILLHTLRQQAHAEQTRMESGLGVLASVGATAPFIGLFGTVWGIMNALKNISAAGSAGLDVVAGPIGEALIATAIGIATAVPAVLAYNYYLRQVRLFVAGMEHFAGAFLGLLAKCDAQGK